MFAPLQLGYHQIATLVPRVRVYRSPAVWLSATDCRKLLAFHAIQLVEVKEPHILFLDSADFHLAGREDGYRRPDLERGLHRLIEAGPEPRENAFVQLLGHGDGQVGILFKRLPLQVLSLDCRTLEQALDGPADEQLLLLGRLRPRGDQVVETDPQRHGAGDVVRLAIVPDDGLDVLAGAVRADAFVVERDVV